MAPGLAHVTGAQEGEPGEEGMCLRDGEDVVGDSTGEGARGESGSGEGGRAGGVAVRGVRGVRGRPRAAHRR